MADNILITRIANANFRDVAMDMSMKLRFRQEEINQNDVMMEVILSSVMAIIRFIHPIADATYPVAAMVM